MGTEAHPQRLQRVEDGLARHATELAVQKNQIAILQRDHDDDRKDMRESIDKLAEKVDRLRTMAFAAALTVAGSSLLLAVSIYANNH